MSSRDLSIVIPVYKSKDTIQDLVHQLCTLEPKVIREIILVNDGSPDSSGDICRNLVSSSSVPVIYIEHARNYGEHNAVMTGLRHSNGQYVVTLDDDMQNPPSEVIKLYSHARSGHWDVVYGVYEKKEHSWFRNLGSRAANLSADVLLDKPSGLYLSSFRCMSSRTVKEIIKYSGPYPYIDGLIMNISQRVTSHLVNHRERAAGQSNYTIIKLVNLWLHMATSFSVKPLRFATVCGLFMFLAGCIGVVVILLDAITEDEVVRGWASLMCAVLFVGSIQSMLLGIIGEYVGRILIILSGKPQASIRSVEKSVSLQSTSSAQHRFGAS